MTAGPVADTAALEPLLAACWDELQADDSSSMDGRKPLGQMEAVAWHPPRLTFTVERHGPGIDQGGTAKVDRGHCAADGHRSVGHRQLEPMQARLDVRPLAEEVAKVILARQEDDRLKWKDDGSVKVLVGRVLRAGSAERVEVALAAAAPDLEGFRSLTAGYFKTFAKPPYTRRPNVGLRLPGESCIIAVRPSWSWTHKQLDCERCWSSASRRTGPGVRVRRDGLGGRRAARPLTEAFETA